MNSRSAIGAAARIIRGSARRVVHTAVNNVILNNIAIACRLESQLKYWQHPYRRYQPSGQKNLQENAGFSNRPEINEAVAATHKDLRRIAERVVCADRKARVLDIGCGPGLYLCDFDPLRWDVTGIDLNSGMCELARSTCTTAHIHQTDFLNFQSDMQYDLIYSVGVFIYIGRTEVDAFFRGIANYLEPGGQLFLNYQHAVSFWDLMYPDLSYIQYSPRLVERIASRYFEIVEHRHAFDNRKVDLFDKTPHKSLNPSTDKTFRNSSVLIGRRA